jgi:Arginyl-tRNA synthetase
MNIFENYLLKIEKIIWSAHKDNLLELPDNLSGINVDIPPAKFTGDISTNVAMVLSKINKKSPLELAKQIADLIKDSDNNIDEIIIEKPGFINLKFKNEFWNDFILDVLNNSSYGSSTSGKKNSYLVEFVSANPTGPLHVGHSRGAILGDVISNLLSFNGHKVTKEYYVNDYGNQISHFTKSVYLRIKEILYDETFPIDDKELYPGDYLIDIAKKIISKNKDLDFKNFESVSEKLKKLSIQESLQLIKINLENLGIKHDNFTSETDVINNNEVDEVIKN